MQVVGSRLRHHVHLSARALPVLGAVRIGQKVELPYRVDAQKVAADTAREDGKLTRPGVFDAVQQDQIVRGAAPCDRKRIAIAGAGISAL